MGDYCIYKHTSPSGKSYVGLTSQSLDRRARKGRGYVECPAFYAAIKKYGWDNFKHEILETGLSFKEACWKEQEYIKISHSLTTEAGYNLLNGGKVNTKVSDETKAKISKTLTGRVGHPLSEEARLKISVAHRGKKMKPRGVEYRKRLSVSLTGRTLSEEHKLKISNSKKGTQTGAKNPRARKVRCVETGVVFDTIKAAGEFKGGSPKNIISACTGRIKTSGGYHWEYVD